MDPISVDKQNSLEFGANLRRELQDDSRVFYVTAWGYAADHYFGWLPKALNCHPEIFALLAHEGSRPKYLKERTRAERPSIVPFTDFLNDMGMTYQAIGDCYSYRAGQMPELLSEPRYSQTPVINLVRHPAVWLEFYVRWRASNMRMTAGASDPLAWEWKVTHHQYFRHLSLREYEKEEVGVWAAFQGMHQLNAILRDFRALKYHAAIEGIATRPEFFLEFVKFLTKGRCNYDQRDLDRAFSMVGTLFRGEEKVETDPAELMKAWPSWKVEGFRKIVHGQSLDVYKSFGYDFSDVLSKPIAFAQPQRSLPIQPIFMSSLMKSGTWLLRAILESITGLKPYEPDPGVGQPNYDDEMLIEFPSGRFFSWHSIITARGAALLKGAGTKNIFLIRNVYDLIVSIYNHLTRDPDAAIGRSIGDAHYLANKPPEVALSMIINGFATPNLVWMGLTPHLRQVTSFVEFIENGGDALVVSYEELVRQPENSIRRISRYLNIALNDGAVEEIVANSNFDVMKANAAKTGTEKHFVGADGRRIKNHLQPYHVAMVELLINSALPNASSRLSRLGVPWFCSVAEIDSAPAQKDSGQHRQSL